MRRRGASSWRVDKSLPQRRRRRRWSRPPGQAAHGPCGGVVSSRANFCSWTHAARRSHRATPNSLHAMRLTSLRRRSGHDDKNRMSQCGICDGANTPLYTYRAFDQPKTGRACARVDGPQRATHTDEDLACMCADVVMPAKGHELERARPIALLM